MYRQEPVGRLAVPDNCQFNFISGVLGAPDVWLGITGPIPAVLDYSHSHMKTTSDPKSSISEHFGTFYLKIDQRSTKKVAILHRAFFLIFENPALRIDKIDPNFCI